MSFQAVERKARELCEAAGLDPDGTSYSDVVWPVPLWHAYVPMAQEILRADAQAGRLRVNGIDKTAQGDESAS